MPVTVRPVGPGDAQVWRRLRRALWPAEDEGELERDAAAYFPGTSSLQAVFLCEDPAGEPLGMLELSLRPYADGCRSSPVPYVEGWYVVPAARRRGIGRMLMAAAETWAREGGYRELASDALLENSLSERAHRSLGFQEVERQIIFRKDL
jgi:aminoglycoside 6'-N-acetyltransferase I